MIRFGKHILLILTLILAASCAKDQREEGMYSAVFRVGPEAATKASADGSHINRYIMEVYSEDGDVFYDRIEKIVEEGTLETEMEVTLHVGIPYNFVFWADCSDNGKDRYYITDSEGDHGLRAVTLKGDYCGNEDSRDAFSASILRSAHKAFEEKIILRRPFARISVLTDDLDVLPIEAVKPTGVSVRVAMYTCMDVMTGELSQEKENSYSAAPYYKIDSSPLVDGYDALSMDYIFAYDEGSVFTSMELTTTFVDGETSVSTFDNVPYRRNYKTNILGSVLTETAAYSILVSPEFDGEL